MRHIPQQGRFPYSALQEEVMVLEEQKLSDFDVNFSAKAVDKNSRVYQLKVTAGLQVSQGCSSSPGAD